MQYVLPDCLYAFWQLAIAEMRNADSKGIPQLRSMQASLVDAVKLSCIGQLMTQSRYAIVVLSLLQPASALSLPDFAKPCSAAR